PGALTGRCRAGTFRPMPPRTLASLAHTLAAAPDVGAALVALGEALAELDRGASVALLTHDERHGLLRERVVPIGGHAHRAPLELAFARLWEREARDEAVRTLEEVTQRVHGEYVRKLGALERQLADARRTPSVGTPGVMASAAPEALAAERLASQHAEAVRR